MKSLRTISGSIDKTRGPSIDIVMWDLPPAPSSGPAYFSNYSPGGSRAQQLQIHPSVAQRFSLVGFSVQARVAAFLSLNLQGPTTGGHFAHFGQLWGGLYVNSPLPTSNTLSANTDLSLPGNVGPAFPPDLSTFGQIWDGATDSIRVLGPTRAETDALMIARNVMLPAPVTVEPSTQLGFGVVLTPSLLSTWVALIIYSVQYTVLYTVESVN